MDALQPIKRVKLSESIVDMIIEKIKGGGFAPGTKLPPERDLMVQLGVGRSTLREAIQSLALMGILEVRPGEGTFIRSIRRENIISPHILAPLVDETSIGDFFEARLLVEPQIASMAAKRCDKEDIAKIQESLTVIDALIHKPEEVDRWSGEFHLRVAYASKNMVCARFVEAILSFLVGRRSNADINREFLQWEYDSHTIIFQSIKDGDEKKAYRDMHKHIEDVVIWYKKLGII